MFSQFDGIRIDRCRSNTAIFFSYDLAIDRNSRICVHRMRFQNDIRDRHFKRRQRCLFCQRILDCEQCKNYRTNDEKHKEDKVKERNSFAWCDLQSKRRIRKPWRRRKRNRLRRCYRNWGGTCRRLIWYCHTWSRRLCGIFANKIPVFIKIQRCARNIIPDFIYGMPLLVHQGKCKRPKIGIRSIAVGQNPVVQRTGKNAACRVSQIAIALKRFHNNIAKRTRNIGVDIGGMNQLRFQHLCQYFKVASGLEKPVPRQQLPGNGSQREHIAAAIEKLAFGLLGTHIAALALDRTDARLRRA